jgi:hypothetical protein
MNNKKKLREKIKMYFPLRQRKGEKYKGHVIWGQRCTQWDRIAVEWSGRHGNPQQLIDIQPQGTYQTHPSNE